jgi:hypothetical protein
MKVAELVTTVRDAITVTKENESSWIFEPCLTWSNVLRRVQHPGFALGSRVFAEPYEKDGVTVIAAATVAGGAGGGGGHDERGQEGEGGGFGVNLGHGSLVALGVY